MRIFFTGATGLLGRYFLETNPDPAKHRLLGTSRAVRDLALPEGCEGLHALAYDDRDGYARLIREFRPDVIVSAGGEGNVDAVERDPAAARRTNFDFGLFLMELAQESRARFVEFSSNAVYDGALAPYGETSEMKPLNEYGKLKKAIDLQTRAFPGEWMILRPIISYGWNHPFGRANPVSQFVPKLRAGQKLVMVDDVFENPVYAGDVAGVLWMCLEKGFKGELNVAGGDEGVNRYQWARIVAEAFGCDPALISPAKLDAFPSIAPRPKDTRFDIGKLVRELGYRPLDVREGALRMREDAVRYRNIQVVSPGA